jgi:glutamate racemase
MGASIRSLPVDRPIGVFDSGVGGLTVLGALRARLPAERMLYLGDTARVPYGPKSPETVVTYALEATNFLVAEGIKLLVLACNTATVHALDRLRQTWPGLPIVGVVEPGAEAAARRSPSGRIAVIATEGTIASGAYERAILARRPEARITARPAGLMVALAEEGWVDDDIALAVARRYLDPIFAPPTADRPDCLVLGCTHYPLLAGVIRQALGEAVALVDSAATTADSVAELIQRRGIAAPSGPRDGALPLTRFLATDGPGRFAALASRFLGQAIAPGEIERVALPELAPPLAAFG